MKSYLSREVVAYALNDFANSAFATTILSVVFNVYFVRVICAGGVPVFGSVVPGESFWGYVLAVSTLLVFVLAPVLGAAADHSGQKKEYLGLFTALGCVGTSLLFFCKGGNYWSAAGFFVLANVGFNGSTVFYNAILPEISTPENVGRVSGFGWALGYIGGGLLLAINLAMIQKPGWFGLPSFDQLPVRASLLSVGVWWAVFSVPFFLWVRERAIPKPGAVHQALAAGFRNALATLRELRRHREVFKFLLANLVYNDGIETVIVMASVFGAQALGMGQGELIACFLMIQAVAFLGAMAFGHLADHIGHKLSIQITLAIYLVVCVWGAFVHTKAEFWIMGAIIGVILGGSQAASRSFLSLIIPPGDSAQFFGFFALAGKLATAVGPLFFGLVSQFYSIRAAVAGLAVFFVVGMILLAQVREPAPA